jgi:hypothetical protein
MLGILELETVKQTIQPATFASVSLRLSSQPYSRQIGRRAAKCAGRDTDEENGCCTATSQDAKTRDALNAHKFPLSNFVE